MKCPFGRLLCLLIAGALPVPAAAADYLVAFHERATVTIYDAGTFELLGSPTVGAGAVRAVGVPDPRKPNELLKIYVVGSDSVAVLGPAPPFAVLATHPLLEPIKAGEGSAVLTEDGRQLLVIGGSILHAFEALDADNPMPKVLGFESDITGLAVGPDLTRAYVITSGSSEVEVVNLLTLPPQPLGVPLALPAEPSGIAAAPNGAAVYVLAADAMLEIDAGAGEILSAIDAPVVSASSIGFDPDAPLETAFLAAGAEILFVDLPKRDLEITLAAPGKVLKAVSPSQELAYAIVEGLGVFRVDRGAGTLSALEDPRTGAAFPLPALDVEVGSGARDVFLSFGSPAKVVRMNTEASEVLGELEIASSLSGIDLVSTPGASPATLEVYGGSRQLSAVGVPFAKPLAVRALADDGRAVFGAAVTFSSATPGVGFDPISAETNLSGVAHTIATPPIADPFQAEARVSSGSGRAVFDLNVVGQDVGGLSKAGGDYQVVLKNGAFPRPLVVSALAGADPLPGLTLTLDTIGSVVSCPAAAITDGEGLAAFVCSAGDVLLPTRLEIGVADSAGRSLKHPFQVTIVPTEDELPSQAVLLSPRTITAVVGELTPDAVRLWVGTQDNAPMANVGVAFSSMQDVTVDPGEAVTSRDGVAAAHVTLGCMPSGVITATVLSSELRSLDVGFIAGVGPAGRIEKRQGDGLAGSSGERLDGPGQALVARVTDVCGTPIGGAPVAWEVSPAGAATLENVRRTTTPSGDASTLVKLGNRAGPVAITVRVGAASAGFTVFVIAAPTRMSILDGDAQAVTVGEPAPRPLVVELRDDRELPAAGVPVSFTVLDGGARLSSRVVDTNGLGRASTSVIAGQTVETFAVEARAGELAVVFRLTVVGSTPFVSSVGFVNGASFAVGWVPGSLGSIFGTGLTAGLEGILQASSSPLPHELGGVRVTVHGIPAPIFALANVSGQEQINIQVPMDVPAPADGITVTIENNGSVASFSGVRTHLVQPGIFQVVLPEGLFAAVLHSDFSTVTPEKPARPSEVAVLFLTGLGPTHPLVDTNVPGPVPAPTTVIEPTVTVDGLPAKVLGSFYAPTLVAVYQINFVIPPAVGSGNLKIVVTAGGASSLPLLIPVKQ